MLRTWDLEHGIATEGLSTEKEQTIGTADLNIAGGSGSFEAKEQKAKNANVVETASEGSDTEDGC